MNEGASFYGRVRSIKGGEGILYISIKHKKPVPYANLKL